MGLRVKKRVFIIDDHAIFREGLSLLVNGSGDLEVCGEAEGADGAVRAIRERSPDIVILDISLNEGSGLELLSDLRRHGIDVPVLVLSMHDESYYAERALRAGARGYIMKQEPSERLIAAVRRVLAGKIYLSERMTDRMLDTVTGSGAAPLASPVQLLSNRELQVLELIGRGLSTHQIAVKTNLSVKTIGTHRENIKAKLKLSSATELAKFAIHWVEGEGS